MDREGEPNRLAETLHSLSRHWAKRRGPAVNRLRSLPVAPRALSIALSHETGTQCSAVGHAVGALLGWSVYDQELLECIAQDMGVQKRLLDSIDEKGMGWLDEAFSSFMAVPFVSDGAFVQHLVKVILALGVHGECVIVGRGAAFILPEPSTLRVRLIAPMKDRVAATREELKITSPKATHHIEVVDRQRRRFVQEHFLKDPDELHSFNLVLDVAQFGVTGCAQLIADAAHRCQGSFESTLERSAVSG